MLEEGVADDIVESRGLTGCVEKLIETRTLKIDGDVPAAEGLYDVGHMGKRRSRCAMRRASVLTMRCTSPRATSPAASGSTRARTHHTVGEETKRALACGGPPATYVS